MSSTKLSRHSLSPNSSFSLIDLPDSPSASSSRGNLTGLPRIIKDCAADIYNNTQKWNALHIRGANLIKEIALLKSDNRNVYPDGLETLSNSLSDAISAMVVIIENLENCMKQLNSLENLHKSAVPLFISWPVKKMSAVGVHIFEAYQKELQLKQFVAENIYHIQGKDKLMFYAASWTYQPYITSETNLLLESFLTETGHRNKT